MTHLNDWGLEEEWRPVLGVETHEVSNIGGVRNSLTGHFLTAVLVGERRRRYRAVSIAGERFKVAELVLEAFDRARPPGMQALHENDDQFEDTTGNLYWGTPAQNVQDAIRNGRRPGRVFAPVSASRRAS